MIRFFLALFLFMYPANLFAESAHRESALDGIIKRQEIRCGYNVYSPYFRVDPNTGEFSGIFYDIMEEIGKNSGLKITWAEEAGRADIFSGLDAGRYDVWCSGIWPNATRALVGSFTHPVFYSVVTPWVRVDDKRLNTLDDIQSHKVTISAVDGAMEAIIAKTNFPELPVVSLPQMTEFDTNFQNIITKKADVTFAEPSSVAEFLGKNPNTLRSLGVSQALRTFANTLAVKQGDIRTQEFLSVAIDEIVQSGAVDKILEKYEIVPNSFLRVSVPFKE